MKTPSLPRLTLITAFVAGLAVGLTGCASTSSSTSDAAASNVYPHTLKGWHGVDSVEFLQAWKVSDYSRVAVGRFDSSGAKLPVESDNTYAPVLTVLKASDGVLLGEITRKLKGHLEVITPPVEASAEKTLLVSGKVVDIHPGSRAARYWGGFGAGSAWVTISGEISDAKTGTALARFEQRRVASMGMFGGDYEPLLTSCVKEIGGDIGSLILAFK